MKISCFMVSWLILFLFFINPKLCLVTNFVFTIIINSIFTNSVTYNNNSQKTIMIMFLTYFFFFTMKPRTILFFLNFDFLLSYCGVIFTRGDYLLHKDIYIWRERERVSRPPHTHTHTSTPNPPAQTLKMWIFRKSKLYFSFFMMVLFSKMCVCVCLINIINKCKKELEVVLH